MKLRAAFAVLFVLLLSSPMIAQGPAMLAPMQQASAAQTTGPQSDLSPRQMLEMRADILMARKLFPDAIALYQKVSASEPRNAVLLNKIGIAYQQEGRSDRAEHYYKLAIKADKKYASALNNLGTVEYEKQKYRKAIRYYKQAIAQGSDLGTVYSNLGYAYFGDKKYADAMDSCLKALAADPAVFSHRSGFGTVIQQRSVADKGLFYFVVAKTYAAAGDAEHCARFLKMARDEGYKEMDAVKTDPAFKKVIDDPRVQEALVPVPSMADGSRSRP